MNGCVSVFATAAALTFAAPVFGQATMSSLHSATDVALDTNPLSSFWKDAPYAMVRVDRMGKPVGRLATEVRSRWTNQNLYFLFICPYQKLHLKPNPVTTAETNELWNWDVAEVFLGSDFSDIRRYKEFELSPQAEWIDIDVDLHKPHHEEGWVWNSGFQVAARIDAVAKIWFGVMRIPFAAIARTPPASGMEFRMNLLRADGAGSNLHLIAWQAPLAETFHIPERFGLLKLEDSTLEANVGAAHSYFLDGLIGPHDYTAAKNSYLLQGLRKGERRTVLEMSGSGSVRHIWATWSIPGGASDLLAPPGKVRLRFFVDGAATPDIEGSIEDLCRAAEATGTSYVPFAAFVYKGAYNFYLPVWFGRSIRIEVEANYDLDEFYTQIDYRLSRNTRAAPRLLSQVHGSELALAYHGRFNVPAEINPALSQFRIAAETEVSLAGPGILRQLSLRGDLPSDARLQIFWDGEATPSVDAPLGYLFADFVNAGIVAGGYKRTSYFPMPFAHQARIVVKLPSGSAGFEGIEYAYEKRELEHDVPHFHAVYEVSGKSKGYSQFAVLRVVGRGLFVGVNLFDTGHNHGGGDAVLIDSGTAEPHVLHGICGEDYFSFAWHQTGAMTPLTGAPAHTRRYRLHLENPYSFHESLQFLFGVFAGLEPKAVVFWYQDAETHRGDWFAPDVPWQALGPLGEKMAVNAGVYETVVPFNNPVPLREKWKDAQMVHGFVDLTYLFRHYVFTSSGTGYVAGASKTRLATYIFSPSNRTVEALFGHDDALSIALNGSNLYSFAERYSFGASKTVLALKRGWNKLEVVVMNGENADWRWSGLSLAIARASSRDLRFSAQPQ